MALTQYINTCTCYNHSLNSTINKYIYINLVKALLSYKAKLLHGVRSESESRKGRLKENTLKQSLQGKVDNKSNKIKDGKSNGNEWGDRKGHDRND